MRGAKIKYGDGYKYQLKEDWEYPTPLVNMAARIEDSDAPDHPWIELRSDGLLKVKEGYAWDGPSGPTIDTPSSMRASLAHDSLYQLERAGHLGQEERPICDQLLHDICVEDGMWHWRAAIWLKGVRLFAAYAARQQAETYIEAP